MKPLSALFWGLVLVTAGVSYRWGSMVGLIFFVFTLMMGGLVASRNIGKFPGGFAEGRFVPDPSELV